ncbi:tyrosine-type recombinase/integrase [Lactiplantibacillus paraxiangfangensis]|uniref:tyrosine-type recombinase/integrase n=1 Tax=Lactiplantibacillus paraxiangfangensis TaxID=3076224 RepID=UPI0030C76615
MKLIKSKKYNYVYSYKSKKGTLYAFRYPYYDVTGKRHEKQQRGYKTELSAHKAELKMEMLYANNDIQQIVDSSITMEQWANRYFEMNKSHLRPTTQSSYRCCITKYIIPLIGKQRLNQLTKSRYDYLFIQPLLENHSNYTVRNYNIIVMMLINAAVDNDILSRNRLSGIRLGQVTERKAFDKADLLAFNHSISSLPLEYRIFFMLLELTGMRKGEAMALNWHDINLKKKLITINKTRNYFGIGPVKTAAGNRTIAISDSLTEQLKHFKLYQRAKFLRLQTEFKTDQLVFTNKYTSPIKDSSVFNNFYSALKLANIDANKYVIHSLRHTHATLLLDAGINPVDIAKRLGHANASITLKIYSHAIKGNDRNLAETMAQIANI